MLLTEFRGLCEGGEYYFGQEGLIGASENIRVIGVEFTLRSRHNAWPLFTHLTLTLVIYKADVKYFLPLPKDQDFSHSQRKPSK